MKTKKLTKYILIALTTFSLVGCSSDFLNEVNPNKTTEDTYWQNEADALGALATIYSPVRGQMYGYFGAFTGFQNQNVRADDLHPINDDEEMWAITVFLNDANNPHPTDDWGLLYRSINRANNFLANIDRVDMDAERKNQMTGEAYFLRAWNYFMLVINWGDVPLRLVPVSTVDEALAPTTPQAEVWAQIESDLQEAKSRLPVTRPATENGRVLRDAATAYLGRAYVYQKKFAEAKTELLEVKNSGRYGLMENPDDNYTEDFEFNKESIFEINYYRHGTGGVWGNDDSNTPQVNILPNFVGAPFDGHGGWYKLQPSKSIVDEFTKEERPAGSDSRWDKRMYTSFFFKYSDYNDSKPDATWYGNLNIDMDKIWTGTGSKRIGNEPNYSDIDGVPGRFVIKKWTAFWSGNGDTMYTSEHHTHNIRVMRYAEVLLLLAEAAAQTGDEGLANECLTLIRDRAGLAKKTFSGASGIMAEVEHQRLLEFFCEGQRFFDLKRWYTPEEVKNIYVQRGKVGASNFQAKHVYLPIPQSEVNTNTGIEQNPLWK